MDKKNFNLQLHQYEEQRQLRQRRYQAREASFAALQQAEAMERIQREQNERTKREQRVQELRMKRAQASQRRLVLEEKVRQTQDSRITGVAAQVEPLWRAAPKPRPLLQRLKEEHPELYRPILKGTLKKQKSLRTPCVLGQLSVREDDSAVVDDAEAADSLRVEDLNHQDEPKKERIAQENQAETAVQNAAREVTPIAEIKLEAEGVVQQNEINDIEETEEAEKILTDGVRVDTEVLAPSSQNGAEQASNIKETQNMFDVQGSDNK